MLFRILARGRSRVLLVGAALGVVAVVGTAVVGGSVVSKANSRSEIAADRDARNLAAVSSVLAVSVSDIHVTTFGGSPIVSQVRIRVAVASSRDVRMAVGGMSRWPRFAFKQEGNHPTLDAPTPAGPTILAAGSSTTYDLTFDAPQLSDGGKSRIILASTYVEPTLGNWILRVQLEDTTRQDYEVTAPVVIAAP